MLILGVISHYYKTKIIGYPLYKSTLNNENDNLKFIPDTNENKVVNFNLDKHCSNNIQIGSKVIVKQDENDKENFELIKVGKLINDDSDDDDLIIELLKPIFKINNILGTKDDDNQDGQNDQNDQNDQNKMLESIDDNDRIDLNHLDTFTIDPINSMDLDDAISIDIPNSKLYVHIADVCAYYKKDDLIKLIPKGNTYYFRNKNIPMLSINHADDLISLLPGSVKKSITVEFKVDELNNNITYLNNYRSNIINKHKLNYLQIDNYLNQNKEIVNFDKSNIDYLVKIHNILKTVESRIEISVQSLSHKIIEEIMIFTNISISVKLKSLRINNDILFRHHPVPYPNKAGFIQRYLGYLLKLKENNNKKLSSDYKVPIENKKISKIISDLNLNSIQNNTIQYLLKHMMSRALYTSEFSSHWGLDLENYCHFTSPIRRASDIIIHLQLLNQYDEETHQKISPNIDKINEKETIQLIIEKIIESLDERRI